MAFPLLPFLLAGGAIGAGLESVQAQQLQDRREARRARLQDANTAGLAAFMSSQTSPEARAMAPILSNYTGLLEPQEFLTELQETVQRQTLTADQAADNAWQMFESNRDFTQLSEYQKRQLQETAKNNRATRFNQNQQRLNQLEGTALNEAQQIFGEYDATNMAYQNLLSALNNISGPGAVGAVKTFFQMIEPNSIVTDREGNMLVRESGLLEFARGWLDAQEGKGSMPIPVRQGIANLATDLMNNRSRDALSKAQAFGQLYQQQGVGLGALQNILGTMGITDESLDTRIAPTIRENPGEPQGVEDFGDQPKRTPAQRDVTRRGQGAR